MTLASTERLAPSPLGLLRSSLFAAAERSTEHLRSIELVAWKNIAVTYTGPRLSQQHAIVWQAIVLEHRNRCGADSDVPLRIRQTDLLRAVGRTDTSTPARKWLLMKLRELQQAIIEVRTAKHHYSGQLIGEVLKCELTGGFEIHLPSRLSVLLSDELAFIDLDRKLSFGRNQLACWLHDFLSTQINNGQRCFPFAVRELHRLCGTPLALPQFRVRLRQALEVLQAGPSPLLVDAHINSSDQLVYVKTNTLVLLKRAPADSKLAAGYRYEDARALAEARRSMVAL